MFDKLFRQKSSLPTVDGPASPVLAAPLQRPRFHSITLRFQGNDVDPDAITAALKCTPDKAGKLFDPGVKTGHWLLKSKWEVKDDPAEFGQFSPHILELLSRLSPDLEAWRLTTQRYKCDLLCSAEIWNKTAVLYLNLEAMKALSDRGVRVSFVSRG